MECTEVPEFIAYENSGSRGAGQPETSLAYPYSARCAAVNTTPSPLAATHHKNQNKAIQHNCGADHACLPSELPSKEP
jgi:hypothetical protein